MKKYYKSILQVVMASVLVITPAVNAEEVAAGTILSKDNYESLKEQTLDGHRIGDLLTDTQLMMVKEHNLTMALRKSEPLQMDPGFLAADRDFGGKATLDAATKTVKNHVKGIPFHDVQLDDPDAGLKLGWNQYYANPVMADSWFGIGDITITDAEKGYLDNFVGTNARMICEGRSYGEPNVCGDNDHQRFLLVLWKPYDIAGLGLFSKQYNNGKGDDAWVYIKSIRRTRRSAGGKTWMDPQPKMDQLNDDAQGINGYPLWYKSWKVVRKRHVLTVLHADEPGNDWKLEDVIVMEPPYWNPNPKTQSWEVREVYEVEVIMPDEHPYGKKVMYMDIDYPFFHMGDIYDKKGELWRLWRQSYSQIGADTASPYLAFLNNQAIDFQYRRATYVGVRNMKINQLSPEFFKPSALKKAASGALKKELDK